MFLFEEEGSGEGAAIKVIGVGGAGCNAVDTMIRSGLLGVDFIAANTDQQALKRSRAPHQLPLGSRLTRGRGAGADPQVGREAALESADEIRSVLEGAEMVFVTAGMGGGTGTGGAPVVAALGREVGALVVGVVTRPFLYENRMKRAEEGLAELRKVCDSIIAVANERLKNYIEKGTPFVAAFRVADDILRQAVQGISEIVTVPGLINVDFADVRTILSYQGRAVMGLGSARGPNRAVEAAKKAVSSPLLEEGSIQGARGLLVNVTGSADGEHRLTFDEANDAFMVIRELIDPDANVIAGVVVGDVPTDEVKVTVIATGFERPVGISASNGAMLRPDDPKQRHLKAIRGEEPRTDFDIPAFLRKQVE